MSDWEMFPGEAQRAISRWLWERHCWYDSYGLPRLNLMPPLQAAYEAILALQDAGFHIEHEDAAYRIEGGAS